MPRNRFEKADPNKSCLSAKTLKVHGLRLQPLTQDGSCFYVRQRTVKNFRPSAACTSHAGAGLRGHLTLDPRAKRHRLQRAPCWTQLPDWWAAPVLNSPPSVATTAFRTSTVSCHSLACQLRTHPQEHFLVLLSRTIAAPTTREAVVKAEEVLCSVAPPPAQVTAPNFCHCQQRGPNGRAPFSGSLSFLALHGLHCSSS